MDLGALASISDCCIDIFGGTAPNLYVSLRT